MDYIEILFDTCILRTKGNYTEFSFGSKYVDFVDFLGANDLIDKCKLNFCRIVLIELSKQIVENYQKDLNIIEKFKSITPEKIKSEEEYIANIDERIEAFIKNENGNIIEIPISSTSYKKIIDRAINKQKPFCGDKGESDKGFKDAIQWESIIHYAIKNQSKKYIFITENKNDFNDDLEKEFADVTKKSIKIFKSIGEAQKHILKLNDLKSNYDIVKYKLEEMVENGTLYSFVEEIANGRKYDVLPIKSIGDIMDLGNNYYQFNIYNDDEHNIFYRVDCKLVDEELIADDIIICL